jgi:plasmid maintenance system antidote protein VapI
MTEPRPPFRPLTPGELHVRPNTEQDGMGTERIPAQCFPIRDYIEEDLEARGWTRDDLAKAMHINDTGLVNDQMYREEPLDQWFVRLLAYVFGTSWEYWRTLDNAYFVWKRQRGRP